MLTELYNMHNSPANKHVSVWITLRWLVNDVHIAVNDVYGLPMQIPFQFIEITQNRAQILRKFQSIKQNLIKVIYRS